MGQKSLTGANRMMIEIKNLTKKYGDSCVLNDVSASFYEGKIYGLVGRNGSGKTMLMKHVCGFIKPTSGEVRINGQIVGKDIDMPDNMGIIIENPGFLPDYSGMMNLKLLAALRGKIGKMEIRESMKLVGLDPDSKKHVCKYSLGMRQRLGLAQALMEDPDILMLDEPLSGLDNDGVQEMYRVLLGEKEKGKLIVIASHSKEDIATLCDEIYRFDKGTVIEHEVLVKEKKPQIRG